MEDDKPLKKQSNDFKRIILDLKSIDVKVEDEDQAIILLSSLPKCFQHFVGTMMYGKATLSMEKVKEIFNLKEIQMGNESRKEEFAIELYMSNKNEKKNISRTRSQSPRSRKISASFVIKNVISRRTAPNKSRFNEWNKHNVDVVVAQDGYDNGEASVVSGEDSQKE